ncbi:MAG TPA: hypothetical protein VGO97_04695 [Solirubrobacterales bacterium]|nr:hypothetical protein [Solirubrobacterales bacterium]
MLGFSLTKRRNRAWGLVLTVSLLGAAALSGCGGEQQDANAKAGTWTVAVDEFKFAKRQPLARPVEFALKIRNTDTRDIPHVALTVTGLREQVAQHGQATKTRPIWVINTPPAGEQTPYATELGNTFDLGPLPAGQVKIFKLNLTPIRRGSHTVSYSLATNLFGSGKAALEDGSPAEGKRTVAIDPTPDFDESVFD